MQVSKINKHLFWKTCISGIVNIIRVFISKLCWNSYVKLTLLSIDLAIGSHTCVTREASKKANCSPCPKTERGGRAKDADWDGRVWRRRPFLRTNVRTGCVTDDAYVDRFRFRPWWQLEMGALGQELTGWTYKRSIKRGGGGGTGSLRKEIEKKSLAHYLLKSNFFQEKTCICSSCRKDIELACLGNI